MPHIAIFLPFICLKNCLQSKLIAPNISLYFSIILKVKENINTYRAVFKNNLLFSPQTVTNLIPFVTELFLYFLKNRYIIIISKKAWRR